MVPAILQPVGAIGVGEALAGGLVDDDDDVAAVLAAMRPAWIVV